MQKVLVTGCAGYIGSVLTNQLLQKGYSVRGVDMLLFGGDSLLPIYTHKNFEFIKGDLRDSNVIKKSIQDVDAIIHLAAIVGDPACSAQPQFAQEINGDASKKLFDAAAQSNNVKRFIFSSTCSNYGKMKGDSFVNETSELNPVSLYARLKVEFENYLLKSDYRKDLSATALRFSTVYGLSSRMRFDLTVNEFIKDAALGREIQIFGEQFWRPYCHVVDLARACVLVLESDITKVNRNVFNVGDTKENYQKKMLADEVLKVIPSAKISFIQKNEDPRDYRVDFSKIVNQLNFSISRTVPDGIKEIYCAINDGIISDPNAARYKNI